MSTQLYWYVGRGSGIVAYLLLTISVVLGIALSRRWHSPSWPRLVVHEAHRLATITFYFFVVIHVVMLFLDPFTGFSIADVIVPFASSFRPIWLSLGIVGAELALAIGASVWVRERIGYRAWHALHGLAYPVFFASLLHGLKTGTDAGALWITLLYGVSAFAVISATVWRAVRPPQVRAALMAASVAALALLLVWVP